MKKAVTLFEALTCFVVSSIIIMMSITNIFNNYNLVFKYEKNLDLNFALQNESSKFISTHKEKKSDFFKLEKNLYKDEFFYVVLFNKNNKDYLELDNIEFVTDEFENIYINYFNEYASVSSTKEYVLVFTKNNDDVAYIFEEIKYE